MTKNIDVKEFIAVTINEIKEGLPDGFSIAENIDFELSVTTIDEAKGKFGIAIASVGGNTQTQNLQKIKFSICDDTTQLKKIRQAKEFLKDLFTDMAVLDTNIDEQIVNNNQETTKQLPKGKK